MILPRYRFTYRERPAGPWRATKREAQEDAVAAGEADWDEFEPDRLWLKPFAGIEADQ